jgi:hypothetical protein
VESFRAYQNQLPRNRLTKCKNGTFTYIDGTVFDSIEASTPQVSLAERQQRVFLHFFSSASLVSSRRLRYLGKSRTDRQHFLDRVQYTESALDGWISLGFGSIRAHSGVSCEGVENGQSIGRYTSPPYIGWTIILIHFFLDRRL